jgi:hypothetical protein
MPVELALSVSRDIASLSKVGLEKVGTYQARSGKSAPTQIGTDEARIIEYRLPKIAPKGSRSIETATL